MERMTEKAELSWPINEIVWKALVLRGKRPEDIADMCGVPPEHVEGVVRSYTF